MYSPVIREFHIAKVVVARGSVIVEFLGTGQADILDNGPVQLKVGLLRTQKAFRNIETCGSSRIVFQWLLYIP